MQKRKPTLDIQTTIVGMEESSKRPGLLKCFHVRDTTGTVFSVGTGYSLVDRKRYWALGQSCLGGTVRVTFRLRSDSGQPLEPRAELVELPNK